MKLNNQKSKASKSAKQPQPEVDPVEVVFNYARKLDPKEMLILCVNEQGQESVIATPNMTRERSNFLVDRFKMFHVLKAMPDPR